MRMYEKEKTDLPERMDLALQIFVPGQEGKAVNISAMGCILK